MIVGVRTWLVVASLLWAAACGLGAFLALRPPAPPRPCHDESHLTYGDEHVECDPGAKLEIYPAGRVTGTYTEWTLYKCVCPRGASADGGTP